MPYPSRGAWQFRNVTRGFYFTPTLDSILVADSTADLATFSCEVVDKLASLTFQNEDKVWAKFAGTRIFAGHLKVVTEAMRSEVGPRVYGLEAQDFTAKLDDSVIDHTADRASEPIADRITWILSFLNYPITTANVNPPAFTMDDANYDGMTVREALDQVCDEARCSYYLDFDDDEDGDPDLHLFRTETISAPFDLNDDDPDYATSFPFVGYQRSKDSVDLATAVYVQGERPADNAFVTDAGAIATWGRQERTVNDGELRTSSQITRAGDRALANESQPLIQGTLTCHEPGLRAGMTASLTVGLWGLSGATVILQDVQARAVDPHDDEGKAFLWTDVTFTDRRKPRGSHRNTTNKNTRKRKGTAGEPDVDVVGTGDFLTLYPVEAVREDLDGTDFSAPSVIGATYIHSAITQNTAYTTSGCPLGGGLWGPGGYTQEAWYPCDIGSPGDIVGLKVTIPDMSAGAIGRGDPGPYRVGWATAEPSSLGDFAFCGLVDVSGGEVFVPAGVLGATDNWLVIAPDWRASPNWSTCAGNIANPFGGPVLGGEGNSGRTDAPAYGDITVETLALSGTGKSGWASVFGAGEADGSNTVWTLDQWNGDGIPEARWGVVILSPATDYTYDAGAQTVTFREAPEAGTLVAFRFRID